MFTEFRIDLFKWIIEISFYLLIAVFKILKYHNFKILMSYIFYVCNRKYYIKLFISNQFKKLKYRSQINIIYSHPYLEALWQLSPLLFFSRNWHDNSLWSYLCDYIQLGSTLGYSLKIGLQPKRLVFLLQKCCWSAAERARDARIWDTFWTFKLSDIDLLSLLIKKKQELRMY